MTRDNSPGEYPWGDRSAYYGRYIGHDYLAPDGSWNLEDFRVIQPIPLLVVADVLSQCTTEPEEVATLRRWTDFPRGAALKLKANENGGNGGTSNGYAPMTFLHRTGSGKFQLIRRLVTRCTVCGRSKVMFIYPDGVATCGLCELERD